MKEAGADPDELKLPDAESAQYLLGWLFEAGAGSDGRPTTWAELNAWRQATQAPANPSEMLALRSLSVDYMAELLAARDPLRGAPYNAVEPMRQQVNDGLKSALRAFRRARA